MLPGGPEPAVHEDGLARREVERVAGADEHRVRRQRELLRAAAPRPAGEEHQRARVLDATQHLDELVLDRLVGADRASEGDALAGVVAGAVETCAGGAEGLRAEQRTLEVPRRRHPAGLEGEPLRGGVVEHDARQRSRRVVGGAGLDADPGALGAKPRRERRAVLVLAADHEHAGAGRVEHPLHPATETEPARVPARDHRRWAATVRHPVHQRGATPPGREVGAQRAVAGHLQQRGRGEVAEETGVGEHAAAALDDEHRLQCAEGGAVDLLAGQEPRPPRLDRRRPERRRRRAVEGGAGGAQGVLAGERPGDGVTEPGLLLGEGVAHR